MENSIILAAGTGTRLKPLTNHAPKCFTEVNGISIIINMLENLLDAGITRCTIVTGYLAYKIKETLGKNYKSVKLEYIHNDIYDKTNDMYSLWLARDLLEDGAIILESDIFFRAETIKRALMNMGNSSYYIGGKYNGKRGEIYIKTNDKMLISSIKILGKDEKETIEDNSYMSSGILVIQKDYGNEFSKWLNKSVNNQEHKVLFDKVISEHIKDSELHLFKIGPNEWVEIDTTQDLSEAEKIFGSGM